VSTKEKFAPVSPDLRSPDNSDDVDRRARRSRDQRSRMASRGPLGLKAVSGVQKKILAFTWLGLIFMAVYAITIGMALFEPGYSLPDRIASVFLLLGLLFIVVHGVGYANSMIKAIWGYRESKTRLFVSSHSPKVTCIVASYNEPPEVLDETIASLLSLDYPNKEIVLLDDSTKDENRIAAREIAEKYGVRCVQRTTRRGYKAGAINDFLDQTDAEYIAIFDADALPTPKFLKECIPLIDENPRLAFLQTPQFYANVNQSYVALAAGRQQNVFYEYIMEGKSYSRAAFCCGTNVIFRRKALTDVNGFDENSVTEDFATSLNMHIRGWDSLYLNRVFVYSLAPENLAAYFMQQGRWSFGSMGVLRSVVKAFFKNPRSLRAGQWWEYFLSTTYYYVGVVNIIFMILPLLYIFFGIKPLRQDVFTYLTVFVPYFVFTLNMFYTGMEARGYPLSQMVIGQQIGFMSFPIHFSSAISSLLGKKRPFGVTPKGVGGRVAWSSLWVQLLFLTLSAVGFAWGMYRYMAGYDRNTTAIVINSFWALYHVWMLSSVFRLNKPVRIGSAKKIFFDNAQEENKAVQLGALAGVRNPITLNRVATVVGLAVVSVIGFFGWSVVSWNIAPKFPVNIYLVDRTVGTNAQEHKSLFWALGFLKVTKQPSFGPVDGGNRTNYDSNLDYYGFVLDPKAVPKPDTTKQGEMLAMGLDRPLPSRLTTPGAVYLIDTYGEFVELDPKTKKYVRYRASKRGLDASEIASLETFARRGGLIIGEWNTLSYPTRPGNYISAAQMEIAMDTLRENLQKLRTTVLSQVQRELEVAERSGNFKRMRDARGRIEDVRGQITDAEYKLRGAQGAALYNALQARQGEAAKKLEGLLHVNYNGWYGRYVDNFAEEKIYDFRLWKNVRDYLTKKNGGKETNPSGPGFVFYPDGPSQIFDPETRTIQSSPLGSPVAILGDELGRTLTGELAVIKKSTDPELADEPLIKNVADEVPARFWFDLVKPQNGARVLANYELQVSVAAAARLKNAGFPAQHISQDGTKITFPAAIAWRDGNVSAGRLRSLYDVADYPSISEVAQQFPALGGIDRVVSGRFGSFSSQFFWNYYEPMLRGALEDTPQIRYESDK
jgi:cellulose synthase (UDP-forming)